MTDPFEAVLDEEVAARGKVAESSPYDGVIDAEVDEAQARLGASLRRAVTVNPDKAAKHTNLAGSTGVAIPTIERNEDKVTQLARVRELHSLARTNPVLARQLSDPEFAKISHDDAEGLGAAEQAFQALKNGGAAIGASFPRANSALWGVAQAGAEVASKYITGPLAGKILPVDIGAQMAASFKAKRQDMNAFATDIRRDEGKGFVEQSIYGGLESLGQNLLTLPLALASGNPALALTPMAGMTGGTEYGKARDAGKPIMEALTYASSQAVIEYATEKLPMGKLIGDLKAGTPLWRMTVHQAALEIPGEQLATVLQDMNEWAVLKPEASVMDYLAERPSAAAQTLIGTLVSVGGQTVVAKGVEVAANRLGGGLERAGEAERAQQFFLQLQQLAVDSKLRERSPESFGAFIQNAAEDGPVTDVYVSGRELANILQQSPNLVLPPSVQEQMAEAIATGGDLRIPIGEYTATLAASDVGPKLLEHLKTAPEAMSFAEAQVFYQEQAGAFQQQAEQILAEQDGQFEAQAVAEQIKQHFTQQLATANRFTPDVNSAYASLMRDFYVTMAQRLGITPQEMLARYPLQVQAERGKGEALDQKTAKTFKRADIDKLNLTQTEAFVKKHGALPRWLPEKMSGPSADYVRDNGEFAFGTDEQGKAQAEQYARALELGEGGKWTVDNASGRWRAKRDQTSTLDQQERGQIAFGKDITKGAMVSLLKNADLSTFLHEAGHFYLEVLAHVAQQPGAPDAVIADMNAALKWMGVKSFADWQKMTLAQKREHHEKFARGFEAYLFEGKSPSVEAQSLFSKFRSWLLNVYKSLASLNVELSDDVRAVFDRMLASEEQIASSKALRDIAPMFATPAEAKATAAEWQAYQNLGADQTEDAVRQLERRSLADLKWAAKAREGYVKKLQDEAAEKRKSMRAEIAAEVAKEPVHRAVRFLTKGEVTDGTTEIKALKGHKLDRAAVESLLAARGMDPKLLGDTTVARTMTIKEGGLQPGLVAEMFGFTSGDHLFFEVLGADMERDIDALTDRRMLEQYGDLVDESSIERAASQAVHNEARARFVATELRFLERVATARQQTGEVDRKGRPLSINVLAKAAKQFAEQIIARKRVNAIRPAQYEAAEARAAKAAAVATNPLEKAAEKRNQLVNLHATRAAESAVTEVEKALRYLKKFDRTGTREALDPDYVDQIDQLLERFDLRQVTQKEIAKRAALRDWVEEQRAAGFEPTIDKTLLAEATRQHYSTLTLEEFRGLVDAVKNIEHLGRLKRKLLTAKDEREFKERVAEAVKSLHDNAKGTVKEQKASDRGLLVPLGRLFRGFTAEHRKFSSLMREMDGMKDGGAMWELFSRTMNEAGDREASMREAATVELARLFKPILKEGSLGQKLHIPQINKSLTREERLGIALNMGNAVNRERVMSGEGWNPAQLEAVLDTLSKDDWNFVQSVWDYLESYRPQIAEKSRRVTGVEPEWVDAEQVMTKHGAYKGGYYPIKYDPLVDSRSEADDAAAIQRQMERGLYVRAQTRRGHLEARTESTGRRLRYDLGVVMGHVDQVIHDLSWHEWLIDANRLLGAKSLDSAIREHYGPEKLGQLKNALKDIAVGDIPAQNSFERVLNHLRHGATIVGLGYNLVTSMLQPIGLTQSMVRIGPKWVAKGLGKWLGDASRMESSTKEIYAKSEMMRLRGKTMQREINEIRNRVSGKSSAIEASYFWLIQTMQKVADIPTWLGAYEKAMASENMTEERAIALADQAVIDAQGAGQIKDLAGIQKGGPGLKLFTNFYSFFNTTYNLAVERTKATNFRDPLQVGKLAVDYALLMIVPSVLVTLMKEALKWDDDSADELGKKLLRENISYIFGMMVGLREASAVVQGFNGYSGPAGTRFFTELGKLGKQVGQGDVDEAAVKAAVNTLGILFHLPTGQVARTVDGIHALVTGKTENPGALLVGSDKN